MTYGLNFEYALFFEISLEIVLSKFMSRESPQTSFILGPATLSN